MVAILVAVVLLSAAFLLIDWQRRAPSLVQKIYFLCLILLSLWIYTDFGRLMYLNKQHDPVYREAAGTAEKRAFVHWHEIYHYYLGAKYFPEIGYNGLYETVLLADRELFEDFELVASGIPFISADWIRDLSNIMHPISAEEALERARTLYRPNFTPARWESFKTDWLTLKKLCDEQWLNLTMFDAGFNPPPSWAVIGTTFAQHIPLSEEWFGYPPTWDQIEMLPLIDVLLLAVASVFLFRSFGLAGLGAFWIVFATSILSGMGWTAGSYCRFLWLFGLILGICHLHREEWFCAAFWLAFSACMRIFPLVFLGAAGLYLLLRWYRDRRQWPAVREFILGAALCIALLIGGSIVLFGIDAWITFFTRISTHGNIFFVQHIGYKRIAVFDSWVPGQNFWWSEGLNNMREWNNLLNQSWDSQRWFQLPLIGALLVLCLTTHRQIKPVEYTMLFGCMAVFLLTIPANYYYAMYALIAVTLFHAGNRLADSVLLLGFFAMWALCYAIPGLVERDDIIRNYWFCLTIFCFLLFWLGIRLILRIPLRADRK